MKRHYYLDKEIGKAYCFLQEGNRTYTGIAQCHEDDWAFMSERTGLQIAEIRAEIDALKNIRDNELIPVVKALKHLQTNVKTSKFYNSKSYEARMLRRQVSIKENELIAVKQEIVALEEYLKGYIAAKNNYYASRDKKA